MKRIKLTIFLFLLLRGNISFGQFEELNDPSKWSHFTTGEGLPSDIITNIVETSDSTVWVSTPYGIAWFDDYRWNSMGKEYGLPAGAPEQMCAGMHGQVMAIWNHKLYVGDRKGFRLFLFPNGIGNDSIFYACRKDQNSIFVIKKDSPVYMEIHHEEMTELSYPKGYSFWVTNSEGIWFNSKSEFIKNSADGGRIISVKGFSGYQLTPRLIAENINGDGVVSIDAPKEYIGICEWSKDNILRYSKTERGISVRSMDMFPNGDVLAIYETGDVHTRREGKWSDIKPLPTPMSNANVVRCRKNGDFWIGSENGLYLFRRSFNQWEKHLHPFSDPKNIVLELFLNSKNEMWAGTARGIEIVGSDGKRTNITNVLGTELGLVTGINEDINGSMWISSGSGFHGAYQWNGRSWSHYGPPEGLDAPFVHKIRRAKNGELIFLGIARTGPEPGVFVYNGKTFSHIGKKEGLLDERAYSFVEDSSGARWYGTQEGLSRYKNGGWKYWGYDDFAKKPKVFTLTVDTKDRIWFSNFAATLGYIDHDDSIHWILRWDGQQNYINKVWDLHCDRSGIVWLATAKGLFRYKDSILSSCTNGAGMNIRELRVVLSDSDKIYVGGHGTGIGIYHPLQSNIPLRIEFKDPIIEDNNVEFDWNVFSYWGGVPSQNIDTRYHYDNTGWTGWSQDKEQYLKGLSYGEHTFSVQAKDRYNGTIYSSAVKVFEIPKPFYFRTVFYLPLTFLLGAILVLLLYNKSLREEQNTSLRKSREKIAIDLHDEIGSSLSGIAIAAQMKARDDRYTEAEKKEFLDIGHTAIQTVNAMRDIIWFINPQNDSFENLQLKMKETGASLLRSMDVQFEFFEPVHKQIPIEYRRQLFLLYKEALNNIAKHSEASKVRVSLQKRSNSIELTITDNGKGFDRTQRYSGNGLNSMKQRAEACKGDLTIHSDADGTTIVATLPLS